MDLLGAATRSLYAGRSNTVHGAALDGQQHLVHDVRRLASAILVATIEWYCHHGRQGEPRSKGQFLGELEQTADSGAEVTGAPTDLARCLPT
jgi:hypothetical protein